MNDRKFLLLLISICSLCCFLCFCLGWQTGRGTIVEKEEIRYVKGKTLKIYVPQEKLVPYMVENPLNGYYVTKLDSVKLSYDSLEWAYDSLLGSYPIVDTAEIIADFVKRSYYSNELFDNDSLGSLTIDTEVQFNALQAMSYEFTPIIKEKTVYTKKKYSGLWKTSYNSFGYYNFGVGMFYRDVGLHIDYSTDFKENGFEVGLLYKF